MIKIAKQKRFFPSPYGIVLVAWYPHSMPLLVVVIPQPATGFSLEGEPAAYVARCPKQNKELHDDNDDDDDALLETPKQQLLR